MAGEPPAAPPAQSFAGMAVLVVEDEFLVAMHVETMLRDLGCTVLGPVATITEALTALERHGPDLALLDVALSDGRATAVAEALQVAGVPFAVTSGYDDRNLDEPPWRDAPRLEKPYGAADVREVLQRLCGR